MRDEYIYQHFVPKSHLRNFTFDEDDEQVWVFDKPTENSFVQSTANVGGDEFFYDSESKPEAEVEEFLQTIENDALHPYKLILTTRSLGCVTPQDKRDLADFLALQLLRTEERRNGIQDVKEMVEESLKERFGIDMGLDDEEEFEELLRDSHSEGLTNGEIDEYSEILTDKKWLIMENRTDMPLWTSDHPVVLHNELEFSEWESGHGIAVEGVQIFFPLSPELMLQLIDPAYFPFKTEKWTIVDEEHIQFYNELQVRQSNRQIYNSSDNFLVAKKTLQRIPKLKDPHRQRFKRMN